MHARRRVRAPLLLALLLGGLFAGCAAPSPASVGPLPRPYVLLVDANANELVAAALPDLDPRRRVLVGLDPAGVALPPDGRRVLVANQGSNSVGVMNATTFGLLDPFVVSAASRLEENRPGAVGVTPDGAEVWVALPAAHRLARFDARTRQPLPAVSLPFEPGRFAFAASGEAWVTERLGPHLAVVDGNRSVAGAWEAGTALADVAVREALVFLLDRADGLRILWAANRTERDLVPLQEGYERLVLSGDGSALAAANPGAGTVLFMDGVRQLHREPRVGGAPLALAFHDDTGRLVVGTGSGRLLLFDGLGRLVRERVVGGDLVDAVVVR